MGKLSDQDLVNRSLEGLAALGYRDFKVLETRVIRLNRSYPVYRPGFEPELKTVIDRLDSYKKFKTIGRQAVSITLVTLDAMDMGYGVARWLNASQREEWAMERQRTEHYPVLD